jgi:hypothetical protein
MSIPSKFVTIILLLVSTRNKLVLYSLRFIILVILTFLIHSFYYNYTRNDEYYEIWGVIIIH